MSVTIDLRHYYQDAKKQGMADYCPAKVPLQVSEGLKVRDRFEPVGDIDVSEDQKGGNPSILVSFWPKEEKPNNTEFVEFCMESPFVKEEILWRIDKLVVDPRQLDWHGNHSLFSHILAESCSLFLGLDFDSNPELKLSSAVLREEWFAVVIGVEGWEKVFEVL